MDNNTQNINIELEDNEKILWSGKPGPFKLFEEGIGKPMIIRWIITVVCVIAVFILYLVFVSSDETISFNMILPIVLIIILGFTFIRPLFDIHTLRKNSKYYITSKRVIVSNGPDNISAMPLDEVDRVRFIKKKNGYADVVFGKDAIRRRYSKIRATALVPIEDLVSGDKKVTGAAFYHVSDADSIKTYILPGTYMDEQTL